MEPEDLYRIEMSAYVAVLQAAKACGELAEDCDVPLAYRNDEFRARWKQAVIDACHGLVYVRLPSQGKTDPAKPRKPMDA